ncbi:MAG: aldehyde dehydrogenase family protein [Candidatus Omnitrophota bacterium]
MKTLTIINPSTSEVITQLEADSDERVESALAKARGSFDNGRWPRMPLATRKDILLKISGGILENAAELAKLESMNSGKPIKETTFMDIPSSAKAFEDAALAMEEYLKPEELEVENAKSLLVRQPQGVVVLIVPWNYPLLMASWKLASALAAGNTVILKPSSLTPLTALELIKIMDDAGLPEGTVNLIIGSGSQVGEKLCSDKRVDMISFTGSNEVGKEIFKYTASGVKKLLMELGGKSASIILKDADMELAVNGSLVSAFLNQGQMCTQMSRILVDEEIYEIFIETFLDKVKKFKLGVALEHETQMGPMISESQRKKVQTLVEKAKKEGAELLCGGNIPKDEELKDGYFFEPTVFAEVDPRNPIFQQEVFGPVVCINKFCGSDEAIKLANDSDFGLAACVWSSDADKAREIAGQINAGTVWINTYGMFYSRLPYGGFKQSGFGKELGREGMLEYTKLKNIFIDQTKGTKPIVNYWYGV